ncbi:hypothetical protein [Streptomyces benahoarensis]|uniref:Uncharacterized protein n=1 Tax=Streptomyces benahoarensis TaxID=2595054 RepID=A0A553ZJB9_9ACTN|nr:hypothetical protein [Streptomyces benahoarensis]TSB21863.1 hypothetical protein FNJ62_17205 [Streptomyces benahoarensis]TSB41558.1 hypothetical protein FNZ23_12410 [Streptomyces benahoarensis]
MNNPRGDVRLRAAAPDEAYADAPRLLAEMRWVTDQVAARPISNGLSREFWLRKAALLDRIALAETDERYKAEADAVAAKAAHRLARYDRERGSGPFATRNGPLPPDSPQWGSSYRPYVRQEYAAWQQIAQG